MKFVKKIDEIIQYSFSTMARPHTTEQRSFLCIEFVKRKGLTNFLPTLINGFCVKFQIARRPNVTTVRRIYKKQLSFGTVCNLNSITFVANKISHL